MKKINLTNNDNRLTREEMRSITAGFGDAPELQSDDATVTCNDGTSHTVSSCTEPQMSNACHGRGDWKICSGGGN